MLWEILMNPILAALLELVIRRFRPVNETRYPVILSGYFTIGRIKWPDNVYCPELVNRQKWRENKNKVVLKKRSADVLVSGVPPSIFNS